MTMTTPTTTPARTVSAFEDLHGETPIRVRTNSHGLRWAVRSASGDSGLRMPGTAGLRVRSFRRTLCELSAAILAGEVR